MTRTTIITAIVTVIVAGLLIWQFGPDVMSALIAKGIAG